MITRAEWISVVVAIATTLEDSKVKYGWKRPITLANAKRFATCVTFVAVCLQEAGLITKGDYINFQDSGNLHGSGADDIKKHPEKFTIFENVNKPPQEAGLQVGDIVAYKAHIMIFAGFKGKTPLWYSLERNGSKGMGKKPRIDIAQEFSYYNTRKIDGGIIRIKFGKNTTVSTTAKAPASTATRYKLKQSMNMRDKANGSKVIAKIPKGAVLTQQSKAGYWIKTTYGGHTGWVCCATTKYATRI